MCLVMWQIERQGWIHLPDSQSSKSQVSRLSYSSDFHLQFSGRKQTVPTIDSFCLRHLSQIKINCLQEIPAFPHQLSRESRQLVQGRYLTFWIAKFKCDESYPQDRYLDVITANSVVNSHSADWWHTTVSQASQFISDWQVLSCRISQHRFQLCP